MRRELVFNWSEAHLNVKKAIDEKIKSPFEILDSEKGWTYVTFYEISAEPNSVLYNLNRLEDAATQNGYFLPWDIMKEHNKVVVTATSDLPSPSAQLFGLHAFLQAYEALYSATNKYPLHGFYGKLGGFYDRPEKGRVLVMYAPCEEAQLEVMSAVETLLPKVKVPGVHFEMHLANALSTIPRLLQGFDDPEYRQSGSPYYRITDPGKFAMLLEQARDDYHRYMFLRDVRA